MTASEALSKRLYQQGDRIAIVGAGVSGLAVARSLLEQGVKPKDISVFERESQAGGKVLSIEEGDRVYELGAVIVFPGLFETIVSLAKGLGVGLKNSVHGTRYFNLTTGRLESWTPNAQEQVALLRDFAKYSALFEKFKAICEPKGFSKTPPELEASWLDFVKANQFERIHRMASNFIGGSGYLHPHNPATAAQMLRMLTPYALSQLMKLGTQFFPQGFQQVWMKEARDLERQGVSFEYRTNLKQIERKVRATFLHLEEGRVAEFDHVFYTGGLVGLPQLLKEILPLERETYGKVQFNDYRSFVMEFSDLANSNSEGAFGFFPNLFTIPMNEAVLAFKPYADRNISIYYAYGAPGASDEVVEAGIIQNMKSLGGNFVRTIAKRKWDYFPHVSSDIKGFFDNVMKLEGIGGLWVIGEATSFAATIQVYEQGGDFARMFVRNEL